MSDYGDRPNPNQITSGMTPAKGAEPVEPSRPKERCPDCGDLKTEQAHAALNGEHPPELPTFRAG